MALSNIFCEPRREITETIIGLAIVGSALGADYAFAVWACAKDPGYSIGENMLAGVVLFLILGAGMIVAGGLVWAVHALGEAVCNSLQIHGIHLRPRQRPGR